MKYSEVFKYLHEGMANAPADIVREFEHTGLVHVIPAGIHQDYLDCRERVGEVYKKESRLGGRLYGLKRRYNSRWHKFWSRKETLKAEKERIKTLESQRNNLLEEKRPSEERIKEIKDLIYSSWPEEWVRSSPRRGLLYNYRKTPDGDYVSVTPLGTRTFRGLHDSGLRGEENVDYDLGFVVSEGFERIVYGQFGKKFKTEHDESIVPLVPYLIRTVENALRGVNDRYDIYNGHVISYKDRSKAFAPFRNDVTRFFASLVYVSAIPYLIDALKPIEVSDEILSRKIISKKELSRGYFEDSGTFGACEGERGDFLGVIETTYRKRPMDFSVADGARTALLRIMGGHKFEYIAVPDFKGKIEHAISEYNKTRRKSRRFCSEVKTRLEEHEWEETFWYRKTADSR